MHERSPQVHRSAKKDSPKHKSPIQEPSPKQDKMAQKLKDEIKADKLRDLELKKWAQEIKEESDKNKTVSDQSVLSSKRSSKKDIKKDSKRDSKKKLKKSKTKTSLERKSSSEEESRQETQERLETQEKERRMNEYRKLFEEANRDLEDKDLETKKFDGGKKVISKCKKQSKIAGIFEEESATDKIPILKTKEQHNEDRQRK